MKLLFLGVASALTIKPNCYHSNMLLFEQDKSLLIDCGSDVRFSLTTQKLSDKDIHNVYISHLHADHVGGLEWLCFSQKFTNPVKEKTHLYISEHLTHELWNNTLKGGLSSLEGEIATLDSFFKVYAIKDNDSFQWEGTNFYLVQTIHMINHFQIMPSYGLFFTIEGIKVYITTDTKFTPEHLEIYYKKADIIFHDCETTPHRSYVHAHYEDLLALPPEIRKKIWLYHYQIEHIRDAKKDGFRGFVKQGQLFDFTNPKTFL